MIENTFWVLKSKIRKAFLEGQEKHRGGKVISLNTNGTKPQTKQYTTIRYSTKIIPHTLTINPSPLQTMKNDNFTTKILLDSPQQNIFGMT